MEHYNKQFKDDNQTEIENIFEDEFNDGNNKIKEISATSNILSSPTDEEDFLTAMKEQWWFNLFDPKNSQFDVILTAKERFIFTNFVFIIYSLNFRESLLY
jgi:hypothetical protein